MALKRRAAWLVLGALLTVAAGLPLWLRLPAPQDAQAVAAAICLQGCAETARVELPHAQDARGGRAEYRLAFDVPAGQVARPLYLFIPLLSQRAIVSLAGREIADTGNRTLMTGLTSGVTTLIPLPGDALAPGPNTVDVTLLTQGVVRSYLSPAYVGTADQLAAYYRLRLFLLEHLRLMTLAAQLLVTLAVLVAWRYRPREALFGWMFLLLGASLLGYAGLLADAHPHMQQLLAYSFFLNAAAGFILPIVALLVNGRPAPRWLQACAAAVPAGCVLLVVAGVLPASSVVLAIAIPLMVCGILAAFAISARGALAGKVAEAWLLLVPLAMLAAATLHDAAVAARWLDGPVFLAFYYRQAVTIGIAVILARRLGLSLRQLDGANARLTRRLAEREAELARLHQEERHKAARRVRSEERQRLTADLHDGLSGHLASIIALAERERSPAIERSAREALDDLRVVIHSLDVGDRELAAALSGLRERLQRQLKRMGVELEWSIARLPEISGVTPAHALNVLRIVQEAVTNAARHGPATRIAVLGRPGGQGSAVLSIDNDGKPFSRGSGSGLANMQRRAGLLGATLRIEPLPAGTRVSLTLPGQLPERAEADTARPQAASAAMPRPG